MPIINGKTILLNALKQKKAVLHANVISYDFAKTAILAANEINKPIIIAVSEKALKLCFCGCKDFASMVKSIVEYFKVKVPVVIHLDHGEYNTVIEAINNGFTSVMYDGSKLPFNENLKKTKEIVKFAHKKNILVEAEIGTVLGKSTDANFEIKLAEVNECIQMAKIGVDILAVGIGNLHGKYPANWQGLNFNKLKEIHNALPKLPLVLHGGSGIPKQQIKKAISLGVCKFNVGTELLTSFTDGLVKYFNTNKTNYKSDPRVYFPIALENTKKVIIEKINFLNS